MARKFNSLLLHLPIYEPPLSSMLIGLGIGVCFEEINVHEQEKSFDMKGEESG